jgi:hypothetical protein
VRAVVLPAHRTLGTISEAVNACIALRADSNAVSNFNAPNGLRADTDCGSHDFVADTAGVCSRSLLRCVSNH